MASNFDNIIADRIRELGYDPSVDPTVVVETKKADILSSMAASQKAVDLHRATAQKQAELDAKADKMSMAGQLNLDRDSIFFQPVNTVAGVVSGLSNIVGRALGAQGELGAQAYDFSDDDIAAYNRYLLADGSATPEDIKRLNSIPNVPNANAMAGKLAQPINANVGKTVLERIEESLRIRDQAQERVKLFDNSSIVHQGDRRDFLAKLEYQMGPNGRMDMSRLSQDNFDKAGQGDVKAIGSILRGIWDNTGVMFDSAAAHPAAMFSYLAENSLETLAVMYGGTAGLAAASLSNINYAAEQFQQGMVAYSERNGGKLPSKAEINKMAMQAASLAAAEQLGDIAMGGLSKTGGLAAKVAQKAAEGTIGRAAQVATKGATAVGKVVPTKTLSAVATEGLTEGYQTGVESLIMGEQIDPAEVITATTIGGAIGGIFGSVGSVANQAKLKAAEAAVAKGNPSAPKEVQEAARQALESGDITTLTDPKNKSYSPGSAVAVLNQLALREDITPEQKAAYLKQAEEINTKNSTYLQSNREILDGTTLASLQADLQEANSNLSSFPEGSQEYQDTQEMISFIEEDIASTQASMAKPKAIENRIKKLEATQGMIDTNLRRFQEQMASTEDVTTATQTIKSRDTSPEAKTSAVNSIITASLGSPADMDIENINRIVNDTGNGITDSQRKTLRALSAARQAELEFQTAEGVTNEILNGNKATKQLGLKDYRTRIVAALNNGDENVVNQYLGWLKNFAESHESKANVYAEGLSEGKGTQIIRNEDGFWEINRGKKLTGETRSANRALFTNSPKLANGIRKEANLIKAELEAMLAIVENSSNTDGNSNQSAPEGAQTTTTNEENNGQNLSQEQTGEPQGEPNVTVQENEETDENDVEGTGQATGTEGVSSEPVVTSEEVITDLENASALVDNTEQEEGIQGQSINDEGDVVTEEVTNDDIVEDNVEASENAKLSVFQQEESAPNTSYEKRNLIRDFFTQKKGGSTKENGKALAWTKDLLSSIGDNYAALAEFAGNFTPSGAQVNAISKFIEFAGNFSGLIEGDIKPKNENYRYEDFMQFFITKEGNKITVDENLLVGMSYAAFTWMNEASGRTLYNSNDSIAAILGYDIQRNERAPTEALNLLREVGSNEAETARSLGKKAVSVLGLKPTADAYVNLLPQLEIHLGSYIIKAMYDQGLLVRNTVPSKTIAKYHAKPDSVTVHDNFSFNFARVATLRNDSFTMDPKAASIIDANKGTQSIITRIFESKVPVIMPTTEPVKSRQKRTKSGQLVPAKLRRIINKMNAKPYKINHASKSVFDKLSAEVQVLIAGGVDTTQVMSDYSRASAEAKNNALMREVETLNDFTNNEMEDIDGDFFLQHEAWVNQRVGITTAINPQASKVHRFLAFMPKWETKVKMDNTKVLNSFKLRVLEGFGVKTDRALNKDSLPLFDPLVSSPEVQAAVKVIQGSMFQDADINEDGQRAILKAVEKGGEAMHTYSALVALAQYQQALDTNSNEFKVVNVGEVDGVTNGPMLAHILTGAARTGKDLLNFLRMGGFYSKDSGFKNFNEWRSQVGSKDLYQTISSDVIRRSGYAYQENLDFSDTGHAIAYILGNLGTAENVSSAGRNLVKRAIAAVHFGSAVESAVDGAFNDFITGMYDKLDKVLQGKDITPEQYITMLKSLGVPVEGANADNLHTLELSKEDLFRVKDNFNRYIGDHIGLSIEANFSAFMKKRDIINANSALTFALYNAAYESLKAAKLEEIALREGVSVSDLKHDISAEDEAAIRSQLSGMSPAFASGLSQTNAKETISAGVTPMGKGKAPTERYVKAYSTDISFANLGRNADGSSFKYLKYNADRFVNVEPGVRPVSFGTHSLDSDIIHSSVENRLALAVHDAAITGAHDIESTAHSLNKSAFEALTNYNLMGAVHNSMVASVNKFHELYSQGLINDKELDKLKQFFRDRKGNQLPSRIINNSNLENKSTNTVRSEFIAEVAYVDQYAAEGGEFAVTPEAIKAIKSQDINSVEPVALNTLEVISGELSAAATSTSTPVTKPTAPVKNSKPGNENVTPWGVMGDPVVPANAAIHSFLQRNPVTSLKKLVPALREGLANDSNKNRLNPILQAALHALGNTSITVRYVTKDIPYNEEYSSIVDGGYSGLFNYETSKDGKLSGTIVIMSPDYVNSSVTPRLLIHEIVHAATAVLIGTEKGKLKANPKYKSQTLEVVQKLEADMEVVKQYLKDNNTSSNTLDYALSNVEEYISHGLTEPLFQDILAKVEVPSSKLGSKLITAAKAFIDGITKLLFKKSSVERSDALAGVIRYSSALMYEASQRKNTFYTEEEVTPSTGDFGSAPSAASITTMDIYNALVSKDTAAGRTVDPTNIQMFQELLDTTVGAVFGPFGSFRSLINQVGAATPMDVWDKAITENKAPFAEEFLGSPFMLNESASFIAEQLYQTMSATMDRKSNTTSTAYREINKMYRGFRKNLSAKDFYAGDWAQATQQERDTAQDKYDFVFNTANVQNTKSDHLARFVALSLVSDEMNSILENNNYQETTPEASTVREHISAVYTQAMDILARTVTKTFKDKTNNVRLENLFSNMVDIETKNRAIVQKKMNKDSWEDKANEALRGGSGVVKNAADSVLGKDFFRNNSSKMVRGFAALGRVMSSDDRVDRFIEVIREYRDDTFKGRETLLGGIFTDIMGHIEWAKQLLRMTKLNEQNRQRVITNTASSLVKSFEGEGSYLTDDSKTAITKTLTESGAHSLLSQYSLDDIRDIIENKARRVAEIAKQKAKLTGSARENSYWSKQAFALGLYKATGKVVIPNMNTNPHNIAHMYGTIYRGKMQPNVAVANIETINILATLNTIDNVGLKERNAVGSIMRREANRTDNQNGIEYVLKMQRAMEQEAVKTLFKDNPTQMMFGYSSEIYDPNVTVMLGYQDEVKDYELQGYKVIGKLSQDPNDTQDQKVLLALNGVGLAPYLSAALSMTGKSAKGSSWDKGSINSSKANTLSMARKNRQNMGVLFDQNVTEADLLKTNNNYMVPTLDERGNVTDYRYMMRNTTKDTVLRRDARFDNVLGHMAGNMLDKVTSREQDEKVIDALFEDYQDNYAANSNAFIEISPNSTDARDQEAWARLPEDTRRYIRKKFKGPSLIIRKDLETIIMGYPKNSLANILEKDDSERNQAEKLFSHLVHTGFMNYGAMKHGLTQDEAEKYAMRASHAIRKGERGWQEIVAEMKNNIVIKTAAVLFGNIWSNITLLKLYGVPVAQGVRDHITATKGLQAYQAATSRLDALTNMIDSGYFGDRTEADIKREIQDLRNDIERSPVKPLIDAGLMPTIVEDINTVDDPYSYRTKWSQVLDAKTKWVPEPVKKTANFLYMGQDTPMYQALNKATQYSDFVARYTLYQHVTTRKNNPLDHNSAITMAADAFVNYDIPLPRNLQYMDDMGIVMFTKYTLRIQKVLYNLMKERPASVLSFMILSNFIDLGTHVLEGSALHKIGNNPFRLGPVDFFDNMGDIATMEILEESLKIL